MGNTTHIEICPAEVKKATIFFINKMTKTPPPAQEDGEAGDPRYCLPPRPRLRPAGAAPAQLRDLRLLYICDSQESRAAVCGCFPRSSNGDNHVYLLANVPMPSYLSPSFTVMG
jgi:hypothetical protein